MAASGEPAADIFLPGGDLRRPLFHESAEEILDHSLRFAHITRWDSVRSPHLFMGLLAAPDPAVRTWGAKLGADLPRLLEQFQELFHQEMGDDRAVLKPHREFFSDNVIRLLREARQRAIDHHREFITPMDILITMFTTPNSIVAECFERIGVTAAKLTELAVLAEQLAPKTV